MAGTNDDLSAMKDAAYSAAQKAATTAAEAVKNLDVDKVKGLAAGGVENVRKSIDTALELWSTFDEDGDGKLTIKEALTLLNSKQMSDAVSKMTGQTHTKRTEADIETWFNRADFDKSDTLSKREFAVMYAGILAEKGMGGAASGAKGIAQAVCTALDKDGDGMIGTDELKGLLAGTPLAFLTPMIPTGKNVSYRELLGKAQ